MGALLKAVMAVITSLEAVEVLLQSAMEIQVPTAAVEPAERMDFSEVLVAQE
jgi:hypothetical protein